MKKTITFVILFVSFYATGQEKLQLTDLYKLLNTNYPLTLQTTLLEKQHQLDLAIINTENLPKLEFAAQATYQSDVTQIPIVIPNSTIEPPNKDQYKTTISVNQLIYAGGLVKASSEAKTAALKTNLKQVEVNLYQLKKQVNQLYFSILFQQEKKQLLTSKKEMLEAKLKEVKAGVKYGVLLPSSDSVLETELLKINQQFIEIESNKISLFQSLSNLVGTEISSNKTLENPETITAENNEINRPELDLFQLKKEQIDTNETLLSKQIAPKLSSFATGGYGNPGLNALDNSFQTFYMIGFKLIWNVFDWNAYKKQRESLKLNKEMIDTDEAIFKLNTNIELDQNKSEIEKISAFIPNDNSIISLQKNILKTAESQLKNGVITASAYITELTNLYEAENNLSIHKIQLLLAQTNYNTTKGH